jgi:hypothetical protein
MGCDEQLWYMRHTTDFDPKQKYMTDRYQKGGLTPIRIRNRDKWSHRRNSLKRQRACARSLFAWLGIEDGPVKPEELTDVAIQFGSSRTRKPNPMCPNKALNRMCSSAIKVTAVPYTAK